MATCRLSDLVNPGRVSTLTLAPGQLVDTARAGSLAPQITTVVLHIAAEAVPWSLRSARGSTWLKPSDTTGTAPDTLRITLDPSGLVAGDYRDTLIFTVAGPTVAPVSVPVEFRLLGCSIASVAPNVSISDSLTLADCGAPHRSGSLAKLYQFTASANDSISLRLSSAAFGGYLVLDSGAAPALTPSMAQSSSGCRAGQVGACLVYVRLPQAGTYVVEATSVAGAATGAFTLGITRPRPPVAPDSLAQLQSDGVTPVAAGGPITQDTIDFRASLADPDSDSVRVEVEVQPVGTGFTGVATAVSAFEPSGARATAVVAGLADFASYHWQARAVDRTGRASSWVPFGSGGADFRISVPQPPGVPASLAQLKSDSTTVIPVGGVTNQATVLFRAQVADPDSTQQVRLEVEVRPVGTAFVDTATVSSPPVPRGSAATATAVGLSDNVAYHWQARAVDQSGLASAWTSFGGNAESTADFGVALAPSQLAILTQPGTSSAGSAIAPAVRVAAQDGSGNTLASFAGSIAAGLGTNPTGATLSGTTSATAVAGVATFSNLRLNRTGSGYTLLFSAGALGTTSAAFAVTPGAASLLAFTAQPSSAVAGSTLTPAVQVTARDTLGNVVTGFSGNVTIAIATNPAGGTLSGTTVEPATSGVATFSDLSINRAGSGYTLAASATGLAGATSAAFDVAAAGGAQLGIVTQPAAAAVNGVALTRQPTVQLEDASGNPVAISGVTITASDSGPAGASLAGKTATTGSNGLATFSGLTITGTAGAYRLGFAAQGYLGATSAAIALSAGAAAQLAVTTEPSALAQSGVPFAQQPVVQLQDASGNRVTLSGVAVTAAIASGGGALGGTLTATTNDSGLAAFTNLAIVGRVGARTLSFSATGLTGALSGTVTVSAGVATQLAIATQPSTTAQSGVVFAQQPALQLEDAAGNAVSQSGVVVTAAVASGAGTLGGTLTATTNASGVATFTSLAITGTVGARTLSFSATGLSSVTSGTVSITAGAASQLAITTQPSASAQSGAAFAQQPVVQLEDASGNAVSQSGVVVTAAIATGAGTLGGTLTATTNASGVAAFTSLEITGVVGARTLSFAATGLTGATSGTITIVGGAAGRLAITTQPSSTAQSGVAFAQQPVLQLEDSSGNALSQSGVVVTAAIATGAGALGGTLTATTNSSGVATFANLAITGAVGVRTLSFSATGLGGATSGAITVSAGAASQLAITAQPSSTAQSGVTFAQQPVLQLEDAAGNAVSQSGVVVTAAIATGAGTLGGTLTATTNTSGVATFTNLAITGTAGARTLSFSATGLTGATSGTVTIGAGAASQLAVTTQPSSTAQSGVAFAQQPAIQLQDASGNPVSQSGVVVTAAIATGAGTLSGTLTATTNTSGVATFTNLAIAGTVGARTLSFAATGLTGATSGTITVSAGAGSQLAITTQPSSSAQSGVAFAQQPVLQLEDASGNAVSQSGVVVTAAIATGGGSLGGTLQVSTNSSGVAAFTNLSIAGTVGARTLSFSSTSLTGATSGSITITGGAAGQLAITTQPSTTAQSGVAFAQQPLIQLEDASGNAVSQSGVVVTAAVGAGGGTLAGTTTASTNASGVATFTNLAIIGTVGARTLSFSAPSLAGVTSGTVTVSAGAASQVAVATQPSSTAQSGVVFAQQPVLQLEDAAGNAVSQSGVAVTAAIATGGGTLGGTLSATTNSSGVATFTNLAITGTVGARTLSFAATGLTSVTSGTITLSAGAASQLALATQPSSAAQSGVAFAQQPVIQLEDASGNAVSQSGTVVTAAIASGAGALGGTLTATTNTSGVAAFTTLAITGTVGARTLSFAASGLTGATSGTVTVSAGAASQLAITTQPSSTAQSGVTFAQQPVLQLEDASGDAVSQSGVVVTASVASGGGTLGGTLTATTNTSGVAAFANLEITGTVGPRTLGFAASGLTSATSGTVTVGAGAASQLAITTQPSTTAQSGVAFAQQPVLQLEDASGNAVSQSGVVVTAVIASGAGTLGGTLTATTSTNGIATYTNLVITGTVGARTLSFSATSLTGATSGTVTVSAGAASQLAIATQPSSTAQSGAAFAQQPVIQLEDASGNVVSQSGVVVTAAIASGTGTLGGTLTATTNSSGVASFTNLVIAGTAGARTLSFSATGLTGVTSGTITVSAGAASQLAIATQPSTSAPSGVAFAQQPVIQLEDAAGNAVSQSGVIVTAAIASGAGTLGGTLTATANTSGVATFTNLAITGTVGARTLSFSATGLTSATSGTVTVGAGAASQLAITTTPSSTAQSGVTFAQQPVLQLQDASGNAVSQSGVVVTAAVATGGGTLGGTLTATTNTSGVASFTNLVITGTVGARTLSFSATGLTSATSGTVTIGAGAASQLAITTPPSSTAQSGVTFAQQPVLQLQDASGNAVSQSGVVVTAAIATGGGTLGGTLTAATVANGTATFTNLAITGTIGARTLSFSATGLAGATSGTITVSAGTASQLVFTTQPVNTAAGAAFGVAVTAQDAQGNTATSFTGTVGVAIQSNPGGGTLSGTTSQAATAGVATFTGLSINKSGTGYTLTASATGLASATSTAFNLVATAISVSRSTVSASPSTITASSGISLSTITVTVLDTLGNPVPAQTVALAARGATGLAQPSTQTNSAGVTTSTLSSTLAGQDTVIATAGGVTLNQQPVVTVAPASASQLSYLTPPSDVVAGAAITPAVQVQVRDANGNVVTTSTAAITVGLSANPGSATLGGTLTENAVAGVATFANLTLNRVGSGYTMGATGSGVSGVISGTFSVSPGAASQLAITAQPSSTAQSGVAFAPQPVLQLEDASGNPVSQSGVVVTAAIATGGGRWVGRSPPRRLRAVSRPSPISPLRGRSGRGR